MFQRDDGQKGVRATTAFKQGSFVCEFEAELLTKEQFEAAEREYQEKNIPVYGLQVHTPTLSNLLTQTVTFLCFF